MTSATYAATLPRSQIPTAAEQTPESPKPKAYLIAADQTWQVYYSDFTKPSNVVSDVRAEMTVAIGYTGDADLQLLRNCLVGGTVCLMLADGRAVTMGKAKLESFTNMDDVYDLPKSANGFRIGVAKLSCDSRLLRST